MKAPDKKEFAKKWTGLVTVISGDTQAKLTSVQKDKEGKVKLFPDGSPDLKVKLDDLPKESKRCIKANMDKPKTYRVRLSEDGDEVETVTPARGVFPASKLVKLGPKDQNENYKLVHRVYNEGTDKENSHDEFFAAYEITSGVFKGVELPAFWMHYKFMEVPEGDEDEGFTQYNTADTPQASQLHKLQNWASTHGGVLDDPIKWPDDGIILDVVEERALENDVPVTLVFEDGYIKSVQPDEDYEDVPEDEDTEEKFDEKFPPVEEEVEEIPAKTAVKNTVKKVLLGEEKKTSKKPPKSSKNDNDEL